MMTEYQRMYFRERSRFRKQLKLCDHCGNEPARENRVLGVECQKRQAEYYRRKTNLKGRAQGKSLSGARAGWLYTKRPDRAAL